MIITEGGSEEIQTGIRRRRRGKKREKWEKNPVSIQSHYRELVHYDNSCALWESRAHLFFRGLLERISAAERMAHPPLLHLLWPSQEQQTDFSFNLIQHSLLKRSIITVHGSESSRINMGQVEHWEVKYLTCFPPPRMLQAINYVSHKHHGIQTLES